MNELEYFLEKDINLNNNDTIVIGLSGGPDSMALLNILNKYNSKLKIVCAHVHHNLRKESDSEKVFVEEYCKKNNYIFEFLKIEEYKNNKFSEEEARRIAEEEARRKAEEEARRIAEEEARRAEEEAQKALAAAKALFSGEGDDANMPTTEIELENDIGLLDLLVLTKLAASKGEARRLIDQGGISINGNKISDVNLRITRTDLSEPIKIKKGKKAFHKVVLK